MKSAGTAGGLAGAGLADVSGTVAGVVVGKLAVVAPGEVHTPLLFTFSHV